MNPHSAMKSAFAAAGVDSADVELDVAIARFLNQTNGDVDRLKNRVDQAILRVRNRTIESAGKVQKSTGANGAHHSYDVPRQPVEEGAAIQNVPLKANVHLPLPSSPNRDGAGHLGHAGNGQAPSVCSVREPSTAQLRASSTVANLVARTVLDRTLTSDGRRWGDIHAYELSGMARDGAMAKGIIGCLGPLNDKQQQMQLRDLIRPDQFESIKARADD